MPSKRSLATVSVALFSVVIACGSEPVGQVPTADVAALTVVPTAQASAPTVTSADPTIVPDDGGGLEVNFLDGGLEPLSGRFVLEELLARIPDTEETRNQVILADIATMREIAGIEKPELDGDADALRGYFEEVARAYDAGLPVVFPSWPAGLRDYATSYDTFPYLGFDQRNADQTVNAGRAPNTFDVAFGRYDPDVTADALEACDCDQPDIREHSGVSYYAWGEGLIGDLQDRFKPPFYDHIGRGPRLLIEDGAASYSVRDGNIPASIDATNGSIHSLADVEDYAEAVRWLGSLGTVVETVIVDQGFSVETVSNSGIGSGSSRGGTRTTESVSRAVQKGALLLPFQFVASGSSYDGESTFTGLVLGHRDASSAEANIERLITRVSDGAVDGRIRNGEYVDVPWADLIRRVDVQSYGRFLVARLYPVEPGYPLTQGSIGNRILTVHE